MKLLHVDTSAEWRGGQTQLLELVRRQSARAHVAIRRDSPLVSSLRDCGAQVHLLPASGRVRAAIGLRRIAGSLQPDLVAAHTSHAHTAALALKQPVVVHRRVDFAIRGPLTRAKYGVPVGYIAVSRAVAAELRAAGVSDERIAVVHDGVDASEAEPHRGGGGVGALGALVAHKGHRVLVDAMAEVECRCRIAGGGPLHEQLQGAIDRLELTNRVELSGTVADKWGFLASLDVFAHPSTEEGLGQAVVEAMFAGVPVVASRAGGIPELIEHGVTGRLTPPGDAGALARGIVAALADPVASRRMAQRARLVAAERFGVRRMVDGTAAAYARWTGR